VARIAGQIQLPFEAAQNRQRLSCAPTQIPHEQLRPEVGEEEVAFLKTTLPCGNFDRERLGVRLDLLRLTVVEYESSRELRDRRFVERVEEPVGWMRADVRESEAV
jgi:hypothetical protein